MAPAEAGEIPGSEERRAFQVEEDEPVLKRAASVFFADMVASATSSLESCARSNYPNGKDANLVEPFASAPPFWEGGPPPATLLDLNVPLLAPKLDCSSAGGGGGGGGDPLFDFQEFHHRLHDVSKAPFSQYHYDDHLTWESFFTPAAAASGTQGQDDPFQGYNVSSSHDRGYNGSVSQLLDALAPPRPAESCSGGNVQARMGNLMELLYGRQEAASQLGPPPAMESSTGDGAKVQDKAGDDDGGFVEPLYSRIRSQEEDEQDLEFGNFWDGEKPAQHSALPGACTADCHDLVSSISNLSKVLLSHYGAREKKAPNSFLRQAGIKDLQSAILDLSKCLVHAHGQQNATVEDANQQVEESKNPSEEDPNFGLYSETDEQPAEHDEDGNEQLVTRFKILLELAGKGPKEVEEVVSKSDPEPEEKQQNPSYLDSNQVEQRLALLRSRPQWSDDDGAATMSGEDIQVRDDYVPKRTASLKELSDRLMKNGVQAAAAAANPAADKGSDSSEEFGWEHI
ncbi:hypothetical protein SELMODRAFT_449146 [Selaginella moellendorffii]|uniref:Uncharacterized protein n=1 Tax=Selaginella moellendorffii TaxID=88036 RepID=D8TD37_SELML|nr:uncharacterized protein LOC9663348 isoform X1 [Selaginella moellendorffii]EFJ05412.1 hypothetical protein SELMODRAFT_449146 [Selaginella moellendorffii]|eukprot:XP_002993520.1 uncharacterized protein LOC9663348 isoform X1 [Selaginella moellendorffii]